MPDLKAVSFGITDVGLEREENQDCIHLDPEIGLFLVLDGMGGHQGGATASQTGCEVVVRVMREGLSKGGDPGGLLVEAVQQAGAQIHLDANRNPNLHGMGTTFVGIVMPSPTIALIAHVGDSRAYLMRDGRLTRLTADHTVVAELVALGKLTPEQAHNHPHSSVLSRNLGGLPVTDVELTEIDLAVGDRILLCSDGLNGYANHGGIEKIVDGAASPEIGSADLVELAKRGGGGDNVSVIIIDIGRENSSQTLASEDPTNKSGATQWWQRRAVFMDVCAALGLAQSTIAAGLTEEEAMSLLASSYCEAVYHDLHNTSGVHVWTFADSLVGAWFGKSGNYSALRELFDILRAASMAVAKDLGESDADFGVCLEIALLRSLIVGEMVVGNQIGTRLRALNEEIVATAPSTELPEATFSGSATIPFGDFQSANTKMQSQEVEQCLQASLDLSKETLKPDRNPYLRLVLSATNSSAQDFAGGREMNSTALELYGNHLLGESELNTILEALDLCRNTQLVAIRQQQDTDPLAQSSAYYILSSAHHALFHALALVVIEAGKPTTDRLAELASHTEQLRLRVSRNQTLLANRNELDTIDERRS